MKDLETVIREVVDAKAEQDNQIDLNAYENGMRAFAKAINYTHCCTELCEHEHETLHQGNGFVYKTCTDCGEDI